MPKEEYLDSKLNESYNLIERLIGIKDKYSFEDAYKLLNAFSFTQEISLDEISEYLPSAAKIPNDVFEYTKGFISNQNYKIYALNYGSGFIIIVVGGTSFIEDYYGDTINDFTLNIYYCLEIMCKNLLN